MTDTSPNVEPTTLEEAKKRIAALEAKLDEAIAIILKRDEELQITERRLLDAEEKLEKLLEGDA
jgi:hypothetical protein